MTKSPNARDNYFLDLVGLVYLSTVVMSSAILCFLVIDDLEVSVIASNADKFKLSAANTIVNNVILFIVNSFYSLLYTIHGVLRSQRLHS